MAQKLRPGVWLLGLGLSAPLAANAYLVDDGEVTLVDSGLFVNNPSLGEELASAGYTPADIDRVLVTHYDLDHVGGLPALDGAFSGPVYVGSTDAALAAGDHTPPLVHHKGVFHRAVRYVWNLDGRDVRPVADGDRIGNFTAYHTPGHNPGHMVYVHDGLGVALLGDLVWEEDGELTPPIRFDSYDVATIRDSIGSFADSVSPFEVAAMGHGDPLLSDGRAAVRTLAASL